MRDFRFVPTGAAGMRASSELPWLPALPHVALGLASSLVFGWQACVAGLLLAGAISFVVYLPLIALWLNGGQPIPPDAPAPRMTSAAYGLLLGLWTISAWVAAWVAGG